MYKTAEEALTFLSSFKESGETVETVLCAQYLSLPSLAKAAEGTRINIGAQNLHWEQEGAYTGEISPVMLKEMNISHVIVGHSERRTYFAETDESVNRKTKSALDHGLVPIVCVGETLEEREGDQTQNVVRRQVVEALKGLGSDEVIRAILAYEPVWAIGTGKASTAEDAGEVIRFIRKTVADLYDQQVANEVRILYGGSVKPANIGSFLEIPDIDGGLVGGASLDPDSFAQLVVAAARRRVSQ